MGDLKVTVSAPIKSKSSRKPKKTKSKIDIKTNDVKEKELTPREKIIKELSELATKGENNIRYLKYRPSHGQSVDLLSYDNKQIHFSYEPDTIFNLEKDTHHTIGSTIMTHEAVFKHFFEYVNKHKHCLECNILRSISLFNAENPNTCLNCRMKYLSIKESTDLDKSTEICGICQTECYKNYDYKLTECKHVFHKVCLAQIQVIPYESDRPFDPDNPDIRWQVKCPLCRGIWFTQMDDGDNTEIIKGEDQLGKF